MRGLFVQTPEKLHVLCERIKSNITKYYPDLSPDDVKVQGKPYGGAGTAKTFRFRITSTRQKYRYGIFVKFSPVTPTMNWGRTEYETLRFLYPRMSSVEPRCSVPRPLDYYDDMDALLMEEVEGMLFRKFFLSQNSRGHKQPSRLHTAISDCGRWLKTFHGVTYHGEKPFDYESFVEGFYNELDRLPDYGVAPTFVKTVTALLEQVRELDKTPLPVACWHYDFTPGHVFMTANGVCVIDIHGQPGAYIYEDIGHWLAAMATVNAFPRYSFFDYRSANGPLGSVFLQAYFSENQFKAPASFMLSSLFKLRYLIQMFHEQHERVSVAIHPAAAMAFSRFRLVKLFSCQILGTLRTISTERSTLGI
jgi:hypothetical protein